MILRIIQHINPAASDDNVYAFTQSLASLQDYPFASASRKDASTERMNEHD